MFYLTISMCLLGTTTTTTTITNTTTETLNNKVHHFLSADDLVQQIVHNQTNPIAALNHNESKHIKLRLNLLDSFPVDFMSYRTRLNGGFLVHLCIFIYCCVLLAVVIDSYFIGSLQYFSRVFRISPNISGATLMALGTSSPEFFTSMVSVFMAESSTIVTGVIVGSSIVNTLAIPGICGLSVLLVVDRQTLTTMSCFPVLRDLLFYAITVIIFILSIKDNSVDFLESLIFIFIYTLYIFTLYVWSNIKAINQERPIHISDRNLNRTTLKHKSLRKSSNYRQTGHELTPSRKKPSTYLLEDYKYIKYPLMPFLILAKLTIPIPNKNYFVLTFLMCCVWIASLTYFNLWMVSLIGDTFGFTEAISGMTLLALGTNLPELISSFIIVRKYQLADMAICHTIGSNIFDILICLGLPWFIQILILTIRNGFELSELGQYIIPLEDNLLYFVCLSLVLSILALNFILYISDWKMTVKMGILCVIAYCIFITTVLTLQINSLL